MCETDKRTQSNLLDYKHAEPPANALLLGPRVYFLARSILHYFAQQ